MDEFAYYLDLEKFTLEKLKDQLLVTRLLPSQQILRDDIDHRFSCLGERGISNLYQLQQALKTKEHVISFSDDTGLPVDYLTVLRREVNSYQPKPIKLADFPNVNPLAILVFEKMGLKNTKQLFPHVITKESRRELADHNQLPYADVMDLTMLTDVARLKWVGPKFARLLVESAFNTVEKIANSDYEDLYADLARVNEEKHIYRGGIGLDDMKNWVNVAVQDVPRAIHY